MLEFASGRGFSVLRVNEIEVFMSPTGTEYVRCGPTEAPDAIVHTRISSVYLRKITESAAVRRIEKQARRARRALKARGIVAEKSALEARVTAARRALPQGDGDPGESTQGEGP